MPGNAVEKLFRGRVDIDAASALFYFTEGSGVQESLHRFKYHGARNIGVCFGEWMASRIKTTDRFSTCDAVIPLPLHPSRERKRGYNQAAILGGALARSLEIPMIRGRLQRQKSALTQTKKGRLDRWQQIQGSFRVSHPEKLEGKRILLVDDVVTTGATIEAAARVLMSIPGVRVNLAVLACSVQV